MIFGMVVRYCDLQAVLDQIWAKINIFETMPLYIRKLAIFWCFGGNDKMAFWKGCKKFIGQKIVKSIQYGLSLIP